MQWIEVTIKTTSAAIDLVCDRLTVLGFDSFIIDDQQDFERFLEENHQYWDYVDEDLEQKMQGLSQIRLYLEDSAAAPEQISTLRDDLAVLRRDYPAVDFGSLEVALANVRDEDWENNWKQYYKPIRVGKHLVVVPSWEEYEKQAGDIILKLDPGMAFGTGTHATTRLCMELLEQSVTSGCTVLDVGCGSGILAVCGVLLGASHADGVDIDELAAKIAGENAVLNGVEDRTHFVQGDLTDKISGQYDVICANIVADVIIRLCPSIRQFLKPNGYFLASGIIDERSVEVQKAILNCGMQIVDRREEAGWVALRCRFAEE